MAVKVTLHKAVWVLLEQTFIILYWFSVWTLADRLSIQTDSVAIACFFVGVFGIFLMNVLPPGTYVDSINYLLDAAAEAGRRERTDLGGEER